MSPEELVKRASETGATSIALTDINNTTAIPEFVTECKKYDLSAIAGIEFRNNNELLYIGIARDNNGFRELNEFLSEYNFKKASLPFPAPRFLNVYTIYPLQKQPGRRLYDNERIGIRTHEAGKLISCSVSEKNNMVVLHPVTFAAKEDIFIHKNLGPLIIISSSAI